MLEELTMLVRLQEIDTHLMDIEAEKGDLPEQINFLKREIERITNSIADAETSIGEIVANKRLNEQEIEASKDRLKKSQNTIFSVKTTREYDAISSEMEQAKHSIVEAERNLMELETKGTEAQQTLEEARTKLSLMQAEYKEKQDEMKERFEASQDEELELNHEREKIVVKLKKPVYSHYERIKKMRDGIGVSNLENGACTYCFSMIPPQRQTEVKRMDDFILCEVCGCILVSTGETAA